ncbi:MAG TPA: aldehyde reductase [Chitinophagaceae bacterium]|nr:aldehyde reductase [Chitinophagaceae bacterium]
MAKTNDDKTVLVTGGTGFVGIHCILQLLQYNVKTTVRSLKRKQEVLDMLKEGAITNTERLTFFEADLAQDTNWAQAVHGCTYVLHVASPIFLRVPKNEDEMIKPAVEGTLRVLKAARDAGVKRVVVTSSFGAVGYSHPGGNTAITEESWTNPADRHLSAYLKSKTLAEKAAWEFIEKEGGGMELAVINPVAIFGPSLGPALSSGAELLKRVMEGSMKAIPNIPMGVVDVRDVADLHIRAMTSPAAKGQRFLAVAGGVVTLPGIAMIIKEKLGYKLPHLTTKRLPDWLVRIAALFNPVAKTVAPQLGRNKNAVNSKAKTLLGWQPRPNSEAVLATAESLIKYGVVKAE